MYEISFAYVERSMNKITAVNVKLHDNKSFASIFTYIAHHVYSFSKNVCLVMHHSAITIKKQKYEIYLSNLTFQFFQEV